MNDFDFEVMQKKKLSAGARHRVCGSKSKRCGLPSDHLTPAQLKAKSGPVDRYDLNRPMGYERFKGMPDDLKVEYLNGICERFRVSVAAISVDMFGMSDATLRLYLRDNGLKVTSGRMGGKCTSERMDKWMRWLNGETPEPAEQENATQEIEPAEGKDTTPEEMPQEEPQSAMQTVPFEVSEMAATFVGEFDALKFMGWLSKLPMPGGSVKIRVEVTKG